MFYGSWRRVNPHRLKIRMTFLSPAKADESFTGRDVEGSMKYVNEANNLRKFGDSCPWLNQVGEWERPIGLEKSSSYDKNFRALFLVAPKDLPLTLMPVNFPVLRLHLPQRWERPCGGRVSLGLSSHLRPGHRRHQSCSISTTHFLRSQVFLDPEIAQSLGGGRWCALKSF